MKKHTLKQKPFVRFPNMVGAENGNLYQKLKLEAIGDINILLLKLNQGELFFSFFAHSYTLPTS